MQQSSEKAASSSFIVIMEIPELMAGMSALPTSPVTVKEEPSEQNTSKQNTQQSQMQDVACVEEECNDQRIECTTESQESEIRTFLSKCIFCSKVFTLGDDPKLLECLHAACATCVNAKLSDPNASVDVDVLCMLHIFFLVFNLPLVKLIFVYM